MKHLLATKIAIALMCCNVVYGTHNTEKNYSGIDSLLFDDVENVVHALPYIPALCNEPEKFVSSVKLAAAILGEEKTNAVAQQALVQLFKNSTTKRAEDHNVLITLCNRIILLLKPIFPNKYLLNYY